MRNVWTLAIGFLVGACSSTPARQPTTPPPHGDLVVEKPQEPEEPIRNYLAPPEPEIKTPDKVDLPAVPSFDLPLLTNGSHSVKELRVKGTKLLDTEVTVTGVITFAYDCATAIRQPKQTEKQVREQIENDPTVCERPKFYVGDSATTPVEKSLWVVDVPRPFNKVERKNGPKEDLKNPPPDRCDDTKKGTCPVYRVGDSVVITGRFALTSPHSERNSDGLLIYQRMKNSTHTWESARKVVIPPPSAGAPSGAAPAMTARPATKPAPDTTAVDVVIASKRSLAAGNKALGTKQFETALVLYKEATDAWDGNHSAWYGLGGTHASLGNWAAAADAFTNSVRLVPDASMYQMWLGIALYEKSVQNAREDQARREGRKPDEVRADLSVVNFETSYQHLAEAVKLEDRLWRAHYYLGRITREQGKAKDAADEFGKAITRSPRESGPFIALGELYRKWDYTDEAIKVAAQGAALVPGANESSDIWFVLGMAYDDKRMDQKAIEAFTEALDRRADNVKAKFQRGQVYFRDGDYIKAKADLEEFARSTNGSMDLKQTASRMLMDIAAKIAP